MTTGRGATEKGLAATDLAVLAAAVAGGKRPTVYLNDAVPGLGLPAGASAKVVAVEGATVRVRPRGVADELPFEASELRASKSVRAAAKGVGAGAAKPVDGAAKPVDGAAKPAARSARAKVGGAVTISLSCDDGGSWTVAVTQGERRPSKPRPIQADAVEKAIGVLGDPAAEAAVRAALDAARVAASRRVEELSRQLDEARSALEALR